MVSRKIGIFLLAAGMTFESAAVNSLADVFSVIFENDEQCESNIVLNANGTYSYKCDESMETWNQLGTADEMIEKTTISETEMAALTTAQLLDLVLEYPLSCNLYLYDTYLDGYEHMRENCSAMSALLERDDVFDVILQRYEEYQIPSKKIMAYDELIDEDNYVESYNQLIADEDYQELILDDFYAFSSVDILETMLLELIEDGVGSESDFLVAYEGKAEEKAQSEYYEDIDVYYVLELMQENSSDVSIMNDVNVLTATRFTTQNGSSLDYKYSTEETYLDASAYSSSLVKYHGSLVSKARTSYNCHSFAWLQNLYPSEYQNIWLNSCSPFVVDGSYVRRSSGVASDIITWTGHSGIITQASINNPYNNYIPEPYMMSKWGQGPIVSHYQSLSPYSEGVTGYECYYKAS